MKRVFVSYSRRNKAFCARLSRDLSDAGLDVWVDFRQIQGGELWQNEIFRGIERSEIVVFCLSPESVASEWCRREVLTARAQGKHIIPVMLKNAFDALNNQEDMRWMLDLHILMFEDRYEAAFPELLDALPGVRRIGVYDDVPVEKIPNPFKGLEAFQQTDAHFFFGREELIEKSLQRLRQDRRTRFLAVVGASGSGKSSLVRAGVIPKIRAGALPGSDQWPLVIFTPGQEPVAALVTRLLPLLGEGYAEESVKQQLAENPQTLLKLADAILDGTPQSRLVLVVDQFEEVFTRAGEAGRETFLKLIHLAATAPGGRITIIITMRADFFGNLSRYPDLAELFEQENMIIVTEMTAANLLRVIEGPAAAVGLVYDEGLVGRILEDVRRQPGSLPLLEYALKELYERREGRRLTMAAYEAIGGVKRALAQHAEDIYSRLNAAQQAIMRRVLLRLIEVSASGEATRRRAARSDLTFRDVPDEAVQEVIDRLTAPESRLLIASREINTDETAPATWIEISHEALIREWERFNGWVNENIENLRFSSEVLKLASDWARAGRDVAYLLTGNRLVRGELWLESADATALQREFIQASIEERKRREALRQEQQARELELQRQATNRLRYFVGVLVVAVVVAGVLTLFALESQRQATANANAFATAVVVADENAQRAQRSAVEANSLALAASADRFFVDGSRELALALAVEAAQIPDPPPQTQFTLANIAYAPAIARRMEGHSGAVNAVAFSPDGRTGWSASGDMTVIQWDLTSGALVRRLEGHSAPAQSVAVSPDGQQVASGGDDRALIVWNAADGSILRRLEGHAEGITAVAFSPDGQYIATASADRSIILWRAADGSEVRRLQGHTDVVTSVAFSPDSLQLLSGSRDQRVILWDVNTGFSIRTFGAEGATTLTHSGQVLSVAFSPDGIQAASSSADDSVILWNVADGSGIRRLQPVASTLDDQQTGDIYSIAFSPAGDRLAATSINGRIYVWDVNSGGEAIRFSASRGVLRGGHTGIVASVAYSPDGRFLLTGGGAGDQTVIAWDVRQAEQIRNFGDLGAFVQAVAFSPDGRTALSGSSTLSNQGDLRLWNVETGHVIQVFQGHEAAVNAAVYSPDGSMALSGDNNGRIILWDTASGTALRTFSGHTSGVYSLAFTPDGARALSGSRDRTLILWDVATGQPIGQPLTGHEGIVFAVAVTPDGRRALSGSLDRSVIVWDLETGQQIQRYEKHERGIRSLAISPDGTQALTGASDGSLFLWDIATGAEIIRFSGHRSSINGVDFSPDGRAVISGSVDGTIRLWDVASGFEIRRYTVPGAGVLALDFSPDGQSLVTGMTDRSFRLWRVLPTVRQLLDWTFAQRFVPALECAQRRQFAVEPLCDASGVAPTSTPYPLPTPTATPASGRLAVGASAIVNTTLGDTLNLRSQPGLRTQVIARLERGTSVTLLEGPRLADNLTWWRVSAADYGEGWVVESVDNIQTLLP